MKLLLHYNWSECPESIKKLAIRDTVTPREILLLDYCTMGVEAYQKELEKINPDQIFNVECVKFLPDDVFSLLPSHIPRFANNMFTLVTVGNFAHK